MSDVSVIIPVYNAHRWRSSIKNSIMFNISEIDEVILINDGDKVDFDKLIYYLSKYFPKLIVTASTNGKEGPGIARNIGISLAELDYIAFLDSDDYWSKGSLKQRLELLKMYPDAPFSYSGYHFYNKNMISGSNFIIETARPVDLLVTNFIKTPSVVVRSTLLKKYNFRDVKHEDLDLWLRLLINTGYSAVGLNNTSLVGVNIGHQSVSSNKINSMFWHTTIIKNYLKWYLFPLLPFLVLVYIFNGFQKRKKQNFSPKLFYLNKIIRITSGIRKYNT